MHDDPLVFQEDLKYVSVLLIHLKACKWNLTAMKLNDCILDLRPFSLLIVNCI